LNILNYKGKLEKEIKTILPKPEKMQKRDLDQWKEMRKKMYLERKPDLYNRFGRLIEKYDKSVHKKKPDISFLEITPDGNILIGVPKTSNYWLLDHNRRLITQVSPRGWKLRITEHFIVFTTYSKDENIVIQCMPRKGSEEQDLQRLSKIKSLES